MLHNITAAYDIRLGVILSVLSAIPVLGFIYVAESARFAGFRQKLADSARQLVRLAAFRPLQRIFRSRSVEPAGVETAAEERTVATRLTDI